MLNILVINAGSSSLKYQLIDIEKKLAVAKGVCERIGIPGSRLKHTPDNGQEIIIDQEMQNHAEAIKMVVDALISKEHGVIESMDEISAVGHRVVHGGEFFSESVVIDDDVLKAINECIDLAPLHNPPNITGIESCKKIMPGVPQVAVFDTAFHQTMPPSSYIYAIPYKYYTKYKIRKYGFHGTSHKYVAQRAAAMLGKPLSQLKLITLHLGNGSSVAAIKNGKSIGTSMGFTPLAGVVMGTRCGSIDPAIVTFLMQKEQMTYNEVSDILNKESGVLGISEVSSDFRDIDAAAEKGNKQASLALEVFIGSVRKYIGMYAIMMGGVDAIIFTAGIGENNVGIRAGVMKGTEFLGSTIDLEKNAQKSQEMDISAEGATVRTLVIPTNEELMIALETEKVINNDSSL